jgi:hypothetical protein
MLVSVIVAVMVMIMVVGVVFLIRFRLFGRFLIHLSHGLALGLLIRRQMAFLIFLP